MRDQQLICITLPVADVPECIDWDGAGKVTVLPQSLALYYRPGITGAIRAEVTGPWRPSRPGIIHDGSPEATVVYYSDHPEHWPHWLRELEAHFQP
ncbi:hypothetical protein AB0M23_28025 [Streptomyces sp. NPDC052077]|uniref:hypothetical protein n=1 Tax=Streptomyces sp. NPDC052077 TaxID=3154757 RepID=UPI003445A364